MNSDNSFTKTNGWIFPCYSCSIYAFKELSAHISHIVREDLSIWYDSNIFITYHMKFISLKAISNLYYHNCMSFKFLGVQLYILENRCEINIISFLGRLAFEIGSIVVRDGNFWAA